MWENAERTAGCGSNQTAGIRRYHSTRGGGREGEGGGGEGVFSKAHTMTQTTGNLLHNDSQRSRRSRAAPTCGGDDPSAEYL